MRSGRCVAVKVQRPGIRDRVLADLSALDEVAALFDRFNGASRHVDAARVLQEFRRSLMSELDYREEAANLVGRVMLEVFRTGGQHGLKMAPEMALLGKTLLNLDEIGRVLDPDFDVNASMRRNATALMRRRMWKTATPASLWSSTLELREFAERLPARVNRILDALAGNDLRLKVEVIDHGSIIEGLQKVANRTALGLVLAALIVGVAMLMQVRTSFTILGYPGLAMLLFIAAAGGGCWMAVNILAGDVRRVR